MPEWTALDVLVFVFYSSRLAFIMKGKDSHEAESTRTLLRFSNRRMQVYSIVVEGERQLSVFSHKGQLFVKKKRGNVSFLESDFSWLGRGASLTEIYGDWVFEQDNAESDEHGVVLVESFLDAEDLAKAEAVMKDALTPRWHEYIDWEGPEAKAAVIVAFAIAGIAGCAGTFRLALPMMEDLVAPVVAEFQYNAR